MASSYTRQIALIIILGFVLRLYVSLNTAVINPDGAIYIDQARVIYYGLWDAFRSHEDQMLTLLPFLIAVFYSITGNWVFSALAISLVLGTALLIPMYLLSRRYFDEQTVILTTLLFAVIPTLVFNSTDIIRDPVAWFFLAFGLNFFPSSLLASGIFFCIAFLTRIECFIFPLLSTAYLFFDRQGKPIRRALILLSPLLAVLAVSLIGVYMFHGLDILQNRVGIISIKFSQSFDQYRMLRAALKMIAHHPPQNIRATFFDNTRHLVWFIPFGVILQNALEAFHYPFFFLFLVGLARMKKKEGVPAPPFYAMLIGGMIVLFYLFILANWEMEHRWFVLVILPSFIFLGMGIECVMKWLSNKIQIGPSFAPLLMGLLMLACTLPKDLMPREQDKIVFKNIGEMIASLENPYGEIEILTLGDSNRWISFYANLHVQGAPYPDKYREFERFIGQSYDEFLKNIRYQNIKYVIWEEKQWPPGHFDFLAAVRPDSLQKISQWSHPDTERIILYRVLPPAISKGAPE